MRISDWSSDVCSSDLILAVADKGLLAVDHIAIVGAARGRAHRLEIRARAGLGHRHRADQRAGRHPGQPAMALRFGAIGEDIMGDRSEEHTSELQSLMRLSYAVFCLKKKTYSNNH